MKHPVSRKHPWSGVEWLQAVFTLLVLSWIYMASTHFDTYETTLASIPAKPAILSEKYWNDKLGYGFHTEKGSRYESTWDTKKDEVKVSPNGLVYSDASVKVSYYKDATLESVEKIHDSDVARTFSRLPRGIAVIEGNLSSATAKDILATLHSR